MAETEAQKRYRQSAKGKAMRSRANKKYFSSDDGREKSKELSKQWIKNHPNQRRLAGVIARAKRKGIKCDLTKEDVTPTTDTCPVLGIPMFVSPEGRTDNTPSVDRIYPNGDYTKDNIQIISWRANKLKNNATLEELRALVRYMENEQP